MPHTHSTPEGPPRGAEAKVSRAFEKRALNLPALPERALVFHHSRHFDLQDAPGPDVLNALQWPLNPELR